MKQLIDKDTITKVSSTLNRDTKQFGKKFMFDHSEETCWNSDQGQPQFVELTFLKPIWPQKLDLMFQGGFVGRICEFWLEDPQSGWKLADSFYPKDCNSLQSFFLDPNPHPSPHKTYSTTDSTTKIRIVFPESTDFFGRITIYKFQLWGEFR
eukprot:Sdes_comp17363_c1_seq1m6575